MPCPLVEAKMVRRVAERLAVRLEESEALEAAHSEPAHPLNGLVYVA